jgi:polar amino acid transport system substrate-binding protein
MNATHRFALILLSCLALSFTGCQTTSSDKRSTNDNALRVGVTPTLPPMVFKRDGQLTGLEIDAARALGEHLGRPVRFVELKWEDQIESLLAGRTDIIMSSMTITAERRMRLAFSNTYLNVGQLLLVRRADFNRYALGIPVVLPGTVGVIAGTVGEQFVEREFSGSNRRACVPRPPASAWPSASRPRQTTCDW